MNTFTPIYKIILVGDSGVGKTCLLSMYINGKCGPAIPTIAVEFCTKEIELADNCKVKVQLWDTAGQERFKSMSVSVIKTVEGLVLVYSITNQLTFQNLETWLKQLQDVTDISKKPIIIVGNKSDLIDSREVSYEEGEKFAKEHGYKFFETSAKNGTNVQEAFNEIFEQLYTLLEKEIKGIEEYKNDSIKIKKKDKKNAKKFC